jgi:hypothetical protein
LAGPLLLPLAYVVLIAKRCPAALLAAGLLAGCGSDDDAGDAGPPRDAALPSDALLSDAAVVDCQGDHRESQDRTNDPLTMENEAAEPTGFALRGGSDPFTVCGQIDPAQANDLVVDGDTYEFTVGGATPVNVRLELTAPDGREATGLEIGLYQVDEGTPVFVASGPFRTDYGLIAGITLAPGTYWVNAVAFHPAPAQPVLYSIRLARDTLTCPHLDAASYPETADGAGRGNDVVAIAHPDPPELTASTMDDPEATGLVLSQEVGPVALAGVSAALESDGDSYLDRDTYLVRSGPTTNELEVRLRWPNGDVDLDVYLFEAGDPLSDYSVGLGTTVDKVDDELFTVSIDPDRNYWLWVGAYRDGSGLPVNYTVTVCPRTHAIE